MKTDAAEKKLQVYYKRYMRNLYNMIKKLDDESIEAFRFGTARERMRIAGSACRKARKSGHDEDLALAETAFERICEIVEAHHIYECANRRRIFSRDVLYQHGRIGVYRALVKYDPGRGVRLITYINVCVGYEIDNTVPVRTRDLFVLTGMTDLELGRYWRMLRAFDDECAGDLTSFRDTYRRSPRLKALDDDRFGWREFFDVMRAHVSMVEVV